MSDEQTNPNATAPAAATAGDSAGATVDRSIDPAIVARMRAEQQQAYRAIARKVQAALNGLGVEKVQVERDAAGKTLVRFAVHCEAEVAVGEAGLAPEDLMKAIAPIVKRARGES